VSRGCERRDEAASVSHWSAGGERADAALGRELVCASTSAVSHVPEQIRSLRGIGSRSTHLPTTAHRGEPFTYHAAAA